MLVFVFCELKPNLDANICGATQNVVRIQCEFSLAKLVDKAPRVM